MHDKRKTTLVVCVASYHTQAVLLCDIRTHKQTQCDISSSTAACGFPSLFVIVVHWYDYSMILFLM